MSDAIDDQVVKTRGWTKEYAQQYQLNGLLTGEETPPQRLAEFVAFLLQSKEHHKYLTGCILPYGHDMKFKIEQIAIRPKYPIRAKQLLSEIGAVDWSEDHVVATW